MKTRLTLAFISVVVVTATLAAPPKEDEVTAHWTKVNAVAVYFEPSPDGQKWVNKKLSNILSVDAIKKLILIEAVTSAPQNINTFNVYKILQDGASFYQIEGKYLAISATYKAIIVTKDDQVFLIEFGRGPDGKGLARLTSEKGNYGYFK